MGKISFNNNNINPSLKNKSQLKDFLAAIFEEEKTDFESASYIFCTDDYLHTLNQRYLNHDTLTDIITFTLSGPQRPIISEIYISVDRVRENADSLKVSFVDELHRVMIHGILHLCGYSDHTKELKSAMREKENQYLAKIDF